MSYKFKLLGSLAALSCIGAAVLVAVETGSERNWKRSVLQSRLEAYTDIIDAAGDSAANIEELLPDDIRITILTQDGYSNGSTASPANLAVRKDRASDFR